MGLLILGFPMGMGMAPRAPPRCLRGPEKIQMTNFNMPDITSSMKYALKSVPGFADIGVPHGNGPRAPPRCMEGSGKSFK